MDVRQDGRDKTRPIVVRLPANRFDAIERLPLSEFLGVDLVENALYRPAQSFR